MPSHEASVARPIHPAQHALAQSTWIREHRPSLFGCSRLWLRFTWNVRRKSPTVILRVTHFPQENLIVVSSGPSRYWPVRGSPGSPESHRSCRSCATLHQPGPATSPPLTRSEPPISEPASPASRRVTYLQPPPGPSFGSKVSTCRCGRIAAAHSDASTAPRIDPLDTMSGPAAIASPNPAAVAREIDRFQTKLNHPAGLKPTASKNSPTPTCPASPTSNAAPANPKISLGQPHAIPLGNPLLFPITHTHVPRETGQRTWVTHKSPPASNTDQAMNLFRDKTIKTAQPSYEGRPGLLRIRRRCRRSSEARSAHTERLRTFLFVDPGSGAPAAGHAAATGSRKHGNVPRETERVHPSMLRTPPEGRTPSSPQLLTTPPRT